MISLVLASVAFASTESLVGLLKELRAELQGVQDQGSNDWQAEAVGPTDMYLYRSVPDRGYGYNTESDEIADLLTAPARGARAALDADMLTGWKKVVYACHKRSVVAACPDLSHNKDLCQASLEARARGGGVDIGGAKCVWCENGCTAGNPGAKCEPKNWLEKQGDARDYEICPRQGNPYHTYAEYEVMDSDLEVKSTGGTGGHSKCYSKDSCLQMLITDHGWITSPRCTTCGRRRADIEYVTMNLEVPSSWFEKDDRRRFHNPTFQQEEMQVAGFLVKYLKARDGRTCQATETASACALNADICIRMECDGVGFKPDWAQTTECAAGFIRTKCVV